MKKVILGVGIPGSGKTTVLKPFADKNNYVYVCPDDIRVELFNNPIVDREQNEKVWKEAYDRVKKSLEEGKTVVFDATFTNKRERKDFLDFARNNGAERIQGVFFDVDIEIAKERNRNRGRVVPENVIQRMDDNIGRSLPKIEDGFDSFFVLDNKHNLKLVDKVFESEKSEHSKRKDFRGEKMI